MNTVLAESPLFAVSTIVNSRAVFVPGCTARLGTAYFGKHAASPQHPHVVTFAAQRATVQEPGLPTRWSFGWPYGGQQNACIFSSNILLLCLFAHMTVAYVTDAYSVGFNDGLALFETLCLSCQDMKDYLDKIALYPDSPESAWQLAMSEQW